MRLTTAVTGLTKSENADLEEACKNRKTRVEDFRGKRTLFWNGEKLRDGEFDEKERQTWEVIMVLPGVEVIPENTFKFCVNVKTVIMNNTVKRIEESAFYGCYMLNFVKLSRNLEYIGQYAFCDCHSLTSMFIPSSCKEIARSAFIQCSKLIIFNVPQTTELGHNVIEDTALVNSFRFGGYDSKPIEKIPSSKKISIPNWIKNRHNDLPIHTLCCSEYPTFNTKTAKILRDPNCFTKDDCGLTPLMYLICNKTADFKIIEKMVEFGGKELLMVENEKGWNCLHHACWMCDITVQKLLVKKGGVELADTLLKDNTPFTERRSSDVIQSALLIHQYMNTIKSTKDQGITETAILKELFESKPSYADIQEIIHDEEISEHMPPQHLALFKQYNQALLDEELKVFQDMQEKVPLMRSTITVVGRGRDGKTSTINSLKGLPFQPYCESTKGSETSEVDVHDIGIHVTNVEASDAAFKGAEKDPFSAIRSVSSHLMESSRERRRLVNVVEHDNLESFTLNESGSVDEITERLARQTLESKVSIEKGSSLEEDIAKKVDDINLATSKDGKSIRFTIYDNGGQKVFRCIQNLLLSREGIFIVVFDMMKISDENSQEEALEHLEYWLSSIKLDACKKSGHDTTKDNKSGQEDKNGDIDPSIKYPPVFLVGTHYDEFKKLEGDNTTGLEALHDILIKRLRLPLADLVPVCNSPGKSDSNRLHLYNQKQGLCFWPVDNSNAKDENILNLRKLILDAAMNDEGFDISQEVPISMLRTMDRLTEISQKQPIIHVIDGKGKSESVMKVMSDCGVFVNDEQIQNENVCRDLLTRYHNLGHFIYFHQVESLRDYCILDPQWLIDMITYIVRDFRYHWFLRDTNAIKMNNGTSWNRLKDDGILDFPLLCQLWVGTSKVHMDFLSEVLLKIGIFGKSSDSFTVPIVPTMTSEAAYIESKNKISETLEERILVGHIDMKKQRFALVPFYCRLVNALVAKDGPTPSILFSACVLRHGENGERFALLLDYSSSKILIVSSHSEFEEKMVVKHIRKTCDRLNSIFYGDHLVFEVIDEQDKGNEPQRLQNEGEARHIYRNSLEVSNRIQMPPTKMMRSIEDEEKAKIIDALYSGSSGLLNLGDCENVANNLFTVRESITLSLLRNLYYEDKKTFKDETLNHLGVTDFFEKTAIIKCLAAQGAPPERASKYMVAKVDNDTNMELEKEIIRRKLSWSNFQACFVDQNNYLNLLSSCRSCKVLHVGMHKETLEETMFERMSTVIKKLIPIQCIVFNSCHSKLVEKTKANFPEAFIIHWSDLAENEAALRFTNLFYDELCSSADNSTNFLVAFDTAKLMMEAHNFVFQEPHHDFTAANENKTIAGVLNIRQPLDESSENIAGRNHNVEERRADAAVTQVSDEQDIADDTIGRQCHVNMSRNPTVKAAGTPKIHDSSQKQEAYQAVANTRYTNSTGQTSYSSKNATNSLTSAAGATQSDSDHSMDVESTNVSGQQAKPSSSVLQGEPTQTAIALRQPHNEHSFSQSDSHSSKKRRRDIDDAQRDSDDTGLETAIEGKEKTCNLKCIYKFACGHEIEANCRFITYNNCKNPSLANIKGIQQKKTPARSRFSCPSCRGKHFCKGSSTKKIPIETSSDGLVFHDCFFAHKRNDDHNFKPIINVGRICREFKLKPKGNKSGNSRFTHCNDEGCIQEYNKKKNGTEHVAQDAAAMHNTTFSSNSNVNPVGNSTTYSNKEQDESTNHQENTCTDQGNDAWDSLDMDDHDDVSTTSLGPTSHPLPGNKLLDTFD